MQIQNYQQVFCDASPEICRERDPKGIYADAKQENQNQKTEEKVDTFEEPLHNEFTANEKNWHTTIQRILQTIEQYYGDK